MTEVYDELEFGCNLYIYTKEEQPEKISELTGIRYSEIVVKGMQRYSPVTRKAIPNKVNDKNIWIYKSSKKKGVSEWSLEEDILEVISVLDREKERFKNIFRSYDESYLLAYVYTSDYHIAFSLSSTIIDKINYYGLRIEFDIYSLTEGVSE